MTNDDKLKAAKDYLATNKIGPQYSGWRWVPAVKTNVRKTIVRATSRDAQHQQH